jgi:hypothetical protein
MNIDYLTVTLSLLAAVLSGMGTAIVAGFRDNKKEKIRREEREKDHLKLEVKDLKITLFELEKQLADWKDKYYDTLQQLIGIKAELENALIMINHAEFHEELDQEYFK